MKRVILLFSACSMLFVLNMLLLRSQTELPNFFSSYLNDLLCLPIILSICYFIIKSFSKKERLHLSLFSAFSLAALYSIYFEIYLPDVTERYTSDVVDVILYFTGAFVFWLVQNLKGAEKLPSHE